ncbi:hypothetical protein ACEPAI_4801 [Sanghuangporus weigelae]
MSLSYSSPVPVLRVLIVRHGETNENREGIIQGQMDTVLNDDGVIQAHLCADALKGVDFEVAITSDLKRAAQTAKVLLLHHPKTPLFKDKGLRERYMGELQGVKIGQYDKTKLPKSVETGPQFTRRAIEWWMETIERKLPTLPIQPRTYNILIISHGAFIATLTRELVLSKRLDAAPNVTIGSCFNTSITTIAMRRDGRGVLERYADISHLLMPAVVMNADEIPQENVKDTNTNKIENRAQK